MKVQLCHVPQRCTQTPWAVSLMSETAKVDPLDSIVTIIRGMKPSTAHWRAFSWQKEYMATFFPLLPVSSYPVQPLQLRSLAQYLVSLTCQQQSSVLVWLFLSVSFYELFTAGFSHLSVRPQMCVCAPTTHPEPPYSLQILGHVVSETTKVSKQFLLVLIEASEVIVEIFFCAEVQPQIKYMLNSLADLAINFLKT